MNTNERKKNDQYQWSKEDMSLGLIYAKMKIKVV